MELKVSEETMAKFMTLVETWLEMQRTSLETLTSATQTLTTTISRAAEHTMEMEQKRFNIDVEAHRAALDAQEAMHRN